MGGELHEPGKNDAPAAGGRQYESPRFRRGLDGKIYHFPPMHTRLAALRKRFERAPVACTWLLVFPVFVVTVSVVAMFLSPMASLNGPAGVLGTILLVAGTTIFLSFAIRAGLRSKLITCRNQTMSRLLKTDVPVLIADESSWQCIREQAQGLPHINWIGVPVVQKFEECLLFSASYANALFGFSEGVRNAKHKQLRHGSCLYWLSTKAAGSLGVYSSVSCIVPFLSCLSWLMVFPLLTGISRYLELAGNTVAICEFFSTDLDVLLAEQAEREKSRKAQKAAPVPRREPANQTLADLQRRVGEAGEREDTRRNQF